MPWYPDLHLSAWMGGKTMEEEGCVRSSFDLAWQLYEFQLKTHEDRQNDLAVMGLVLQEQRRATGLLAYHDEEITKLWCKVTEIERFTTYLAGVYDGIQRLLIWLMRQMAKRMQRRLRDETRFSDTIKNWIWDQARGLCMHCGLPLDRNAPDGSPNKATYDHILSVYLGGLGTIINCQLICWPSNRAKGIDEIDYRPEYIRKEARKIFEQQEHADVERERRTHQQLRLLGPAGA